MHIFVYSADAEEALRNLSSKYHQLTPASISDVLPDNYGLYTISFYNKTGIPSAEVRREFSKFGEVKNLTGSLDVKGGRVFVSYKEKGSAVAALQAFFFRKDRYPNMKFALPRCEKDYFGCYCLKFYNKSGDVTEEKVNFLRFNIYKFILASIWLYVRKKWLKICQHFRYFETLVNSVALLM